jgi:hypothetical protein
LVRFRAMSVRRLVGRHASREVLARGRGRADLFGLSPAI